MNTTKKTLGLIILAVLLVGSVYIMTMPKEELYETAGDEKSTATTPTTTVSSTTTTPKTTTPVSIKPTIQTYSTSEVAVHNSSNSCWTIVNGAIYDVTSWISKHPGGASAIKGMCGVDASNDFNEQHAGQGGPEKALASFKIGVLK